MAARPAWTGAIQFGGFPIHLRAYPIVKSRSAQSFKTLDPNHKQPVKQQLVDVDGTVVESVECLKGVEVSKGNFVALDPDAVDMIRTAERTETLEIDGFPELGSIPLHLGIAHYRLVPNDKVPGAEGPVGIIWNGLMASERGLVTKWVPRSGGRDALLAIHADVHGLNGTTLPFTAELQDTPEWAPELNEQAAQMFEQFASMTYDLDSFTHSKFESDYEKRRDEAIAAALKGEVITAKPQEKAAPAAPDLMAAMAAALTQAPAAKTKKPAKTKAKPKAKAKA